MIRIFLIVGFIVCCGHGAWGASGVNPTPGSTEAQFNVTSDGAATYAVPIRVSPGTAGMEPKLALSYSSRAGASAVGNGWSVSGLSSIQRGPRNIRDDGQVRGVQLDDRDALYLDGEKLILTALNASDGSKEYRSRIDNYSRIRAFEFGKTGPTRFRVETRSGLILSFGGTDNSKVKLPNGTILTWLCDGIEDRSGNYISFLYRVDGLEYHISEVAYTGNRKTGQSPYAFVTFNYVHVPSYELRYVTGQKVEPKLELVSIQSRFQNKTLRLYRLVHGKGDQDPRKSFQLTELYEEGADGLQFRPLVFNYSKNKPNWQPRSTLNGVPDFPDIGKLSDGFKFLRIGKGMPAIWGVIFSTQLGSVNKAGAFIVDENSGKWSRNDAFKPPVTLADDRGVEPSTVFADINGDGKEDILVSPTGGGQDGGVHINGDSGWESRQHFPPIRFLNGALDHSGAIVFDIDAGAKSGVRALLWSYFNEQGQLEEGASRYLASGWQAATDHKPPYPLANAASRAVGGVYVLDVDCDGKPELVYNQSLPDGNVRSHVFKSTISGWEELKDSRFHLPFDPVPTDAALRIVDLNKDGCQDVVFAYERGGVPQRGAFLATKDGWISDPRVLPDFVFSKYEGANAPEIAIAEVGDLDGDGRPDIFWHDQAGSKAVYLNKQSGWEPMNGTDPPLPLPANIAERRRGFVIANITGDKRAEIIYPGVARGRVRQPTVYFQSDNGGWDADANYIIPIDVSVFDKVDLGVRFLDLNGDGYADLVWSRKRVNGQGADETAYVFKPGSANNWIEDKRFILPEPLVSEDFTDTGVLLADINGDGLVDIIVSRRKLKSNGKEYEYTRAAYINCSKMSECRSKPNDDNNKKAFWKLAPEFLPPENESQKVEAFVDEGIGSLGARLIDVDGDGLTDLVISRLEEILLPVDHPDGGTPTFKREYKLYSRTYLNSGGNGPRWKLSPTFAMPVPFVKPVVRKLNPRFPMIDPKGDDEPIPGITVRDNRVEMFDLNGDRLPDIVFHYISYEFVTDQNGIEELKGIVKSGAYRNTGNGWTSAPDFTPPLRIDPDRDFPKRQAYFNDVNGDGFVDLIYADGDKSGDRSRSFLNTGQGWTSEADGAPYKIPAGAIRDSAGDQGFRLMDINGDGLPDIVYHWTVTGASPQKGGCLNTGIGWAGCSDDFAPPIAFVEAEQGDIGVRPLDVNGDGNIDLAQSYKRSADTNDRQVFVNLAGRADLLLSVNNGLGMRTDIGYESFLAYESTQDNSQSAVAVRIAPDIIRDSIYPIISAPMPGYLTTEVSTSGPGVSRRRIEYKYDAYRVDILSGRSLGFEFQELVDRARGRTTKIEYLYEDGLIGSTSHTSVLQTTGAGSIVTISDSTLRWEVKSYAGLPIPTPSGSFIPRILTPLLRVSSFRSHDLKNKLLSAQIDTFDYDDHGNPGFVRTEYPDQSASETKNEYADNLSHWLLGRLAKATVKLSAPARSSQTRVATFKYHDDTGQLIQENSLVGTGYELITRYRRDVFGNKTRVTTSDVNGGNVRYQDVRYDRLGRFAVENKNALGHKSGVIYDDVSGVPKAQKDANGLLTTYRCDSLQRLSEESTPSGVSKITRVEFPSENNAKSALIVIKQVKGLPESRLYLNGALRPYLERSVGAKGRAVFTKIEYDDIGRIRQSSLPFFEGDQEFFRTATYDELDRVVDEELPDLTHVSTDYDGLVSTVRNAKNQRSRRFDDLRGRTVKAEDSAGSATQFEFDVAGRLVKITNAIGQSTTLHYNVAGQKESIRDPVVGTWNYKYNVYSELIEQEDARSERAILKYDVLGRLIYRSSNGEFSEWTYDPLHGIGQVAEVSSSGGAKRSFTFDEFGRPGAVLVTVGVDSVKTEYAYDVLSRPIAKTYSTGVTVLNDFDKFGFWRQVRVRDMKEERTVYRVDETDAYGRPLSEKFGNGLTQTAEYDRRSTRLVRSRSISVTGGAIQDLHLSYDEIGNVLKRYDMAGGSGLERYQYDVLNRLEVVTESSGHQVQINYDPLGNITNKTDTGRYNYCDLGLSGKRLCSITRIDDKRTYISYDPAGNITLLGDTRIAYGPDGRVKSIETGQEGYPRLNYSEFKYGPDGELVQQETRYGTTKFYETYMGDVEILREAYAPPIFPTPERTRVRHYVSTPSGTLGFHETTYWHHPVTLASPTYLSLFSEKPQRSTNVTKTFVYFVKDSVGSLRVTLDEKCSVLDRFDYDPWGKRRGEKQSAQYHGIRSGYTGHEHLDNLGLIHMGGRVYSPELGRFISPDPFVQAAGYSQSHNRYLYAFGNPLRNVDPSGYGNIWDDVIRPGLEHARDEFANAVDTVVGKPLRWLAEQGNKAGRWLQENWRTVVVIAVAVVITVFTGNPVLAGAVAGGLSAALYGGGPNEILKGAAIGAATAYAFSYVGDMGISNEYAAAAAQGTVGGASSVANGGNFWEGFGSTFASSYLGGKIDSSRSTAYQVSARATIGGLAAEIGGGKFENGAITSAYSYLFGEFVQRSAAKEQLVQGIKVYRMDISLSNTGDTEYGHWWIEIDNHESYGWWPKESVDLKGTIFGVEGELNRESRPGANPMRDPHHGDRGPNVSEFNVYGSLSVSKAAYVQQIRAFANSYRGNWSYPFGQNCHSFQEQLLRESGLSIRRAKQ